MNYLKRFKKKNILIFFFMFFYPFIVFAQQYENKELIPGVQPARGDATSNFIEYIEKFYEFGVGFAVILAFFMIAFGSFNYIITSAGNSSKMTDAKNTIFNAIFGLVLALTAFLILFLINPDLVKNTVYGPADVIKTMTGSTTSSSSGGSSIAVGPPSNLQPSNAEIEATNNQVTLTWSEVSDAERYAIRIDDKEPVFSIRLDSKIGFVRNLENILAVKVLGVSASADEESSCEYKICDDDVTGTSYELDVEEGKKYYWWIHSIKGDDWSDPVKASFIVKEEEVQPEEINPPSNLYPNNMEIEAVNNKVTLSWDATVSDAEKYAIRIDNKEPVVGIESTAEGGCKYMLCDDEVSETSYEIEVEVGKEYDWWVHSINEDDWSEAAEASFTVKKNEKPPILSFSKNLDKVMLGDSVILTWSIQGATSCEASGSWSGAKSFEDGVYNQTIIINLVGENIYNLECWNSEGISSGRKSLSIKVDPGEDKSGDWLWYEPSNIGVAGGITPDFKELFTDPASWQVANSRTKVMMLRTNTMRVQKLNAGPLENIIVPQLKALNISIALDSVVATWASCKAKTNKELSLDQELALIDDIISYGGSVEYIGLQSVLSKPVPSVYQDCYYPMDQRIEDIVWYIDSVKSIHPEIKIGIIDALVAQGKEYKKPYSDLLTELTNKNLDLDFIIMDHPYEHAEFSLLGSSWVNLYQAERFVKGLNIPVGVMYVSSDGGQASESLFYSRVMDYYDKYHAVGGDPDFYVIASWFTYPKNALPETSYSMTKVLKDLSQKVIDNQ